jgi:uncharacterized protein YjiS (DUF1127 family)
MIIDRINGLPFAVTPMRHPAKLRSGSDELNLGPSAIGYLLGLILKTMRSRNERVAMAGLSDHLLRDIGLTRTKATWRLESRPLH